jgi:hydrogenase-4 component B
MTPMTLAWTVMAAGFAAGALLSPLARSPRAARLVTALGACVGGAAGLTLAALVLRTGQPFDLELPAIVSAAGGVVIHLDRLGAFFLALIGGISLPAAIYGLTYTRAYDGHRSLGGFGIAFNAFLLAMSAVPCAGNVFTFLLAWEAMAVSSYFLVMTESDAAGTRQAGIWYAAMTHFGFVLLVPMFFMMASSADALTFADLRTGAALLGPAARNAVFLLALAAFGSKAGAVPLHVWLPRAHPAAPSHVSALMSGVMIKLGVYGLLRVTLDLLGPGPAWWGGLVLLVGCASALGGILYALTENDLKRLLAYSSVENVGVILLGIGAGLVLQSYHLPALALVAFGAALLHTLNHACFKALLFLGAGSVLHQAHTRNMERMGGLIKGMPQTAALFLVGSAAAAALPPLNGFASEWMVFQALLAGVQIPRPEVALGAPIAVGVLALTSGLAAARFVKAFGISFLAMPRSDEAARARDPHWSTRVAMGALAIACVALGLAAPRVFAFILPIVGIDAAAAPANPWWLLAPSGLAQVAPLRIGILLAVVGALALLILGVAGFRVRRADTWGCGRLRHTPRMEYTSSAFAEPLRRIFSELYRPTQDLSITAHPDSRYFVRSITYTTRIAPWIETALYLPIVRAMRAAAASVRRLQAGSVHLYLVYMAAALVIALASAWWYR